MKTAGEVLGDHGPVRKVWSMNIQAAQDGGFVVYDRSFASSGYETPMMFAGELADCLDYMRPRLSQPTKEGEGK